MRNLSISSLLSEYRQSGLRPSEIIQAVYEQIRTSGDDHVWISLTPEHEALRRAAELEGSQKDLPLYGIPFAVKDNIDVAGLPTTAGCPTFSYQPETNAASVQRLLNAGAICLGKTNMDQFATGLVGTRSPYGACCSVFDPAYISGGSSSGSAVAVAKGEVSFALGTDTAGSGRVPAAFNGIVGLKPTRLLVSREGVVPACKSLDCVSVFAPDVASSGRVLSVLAERAVLSRHPVATPLVGVPRPSQMQFFGDNAAAACWQAAIDKLSTLGADIREVDFTPFQETAALLYNGPFVAERFAAVGAFIQSRPEQDFDPTVRQIILESSRYTASELFDAQDKLQRLRSVVASQFAHINFLVLPTAPSIYKIEDVKQHAVVLNSRLGTYTNFVNLLDLCGVALPAGMRPDGLPFGITLLAPAYHDDLALTLAHHWERTPATTYLPAAGTTVLAVAGAHLSGEPLNWQLTSRGARFIRTARTEPVYRMFALQSSPPKPGLVRVAERQPRGIEVELWELTDQAFGSFVAEIPGPLGIGTLAMEDGSKVKGFLCEGFAAETAPDITSFGSWRNFLRA